MTEQPHDQSRTVVGLPHPNFPLLPWPLTSHLFSSTQPTSLTENAPVPYGPSSA